ncbi:MAG: isoaspartyl peptidase/L-asparaginase, partial [Nannocystaceae bacterium]
DVPIFGAGLFAGEHGAVACTGDGEVIVRESIARRTYEALASGSSAAEATAAAARAFPEGAELGLIAVDRGGFGVAATAPMAHGIAADDRG